MTAKTFWQICFVALIISLFYIGHGLNTRQAGPGLVKTAEAQVITSGVVNDGNLLITTSRDGRSLFLWTFGPDEISKDRYPVFQDSVRVKRAKAR